MLESTEHAEMMAALPLLTSKAGRASSAPSLESAAAAFDVTITEGDGGSPKRRARSKILHMPFAASIFVSQQYLFLFLWRTVCVAFSVLRSLRGAFFVLSYTVHDFGV